MAEAVAIKLKEKLEAKHVEAVDLSDGCGAKIDVLVVSDKFEGMKLLERQRAVHEALEEEMKTIHAITMKCKTVKQWEDAGGGK
mmetsp:Transcript_45660/g.114454  ORF Transcript_45660/g.114454 Transcript_45660/m.114454 type:complete len:84 (-) Transcript_45660:421-672(-)